LPIHCRSAHRGSNDVQYQILEEIPNSHASVIITRNRRDGTTRITGVWTERIQGDDHWEVKQEDATSYASKTGEPSHGFFECTPVGIRAVVACGVTKDPLQMHTAKKLLQSGTIPNFSLRQAEGTVITNYRPPESRDEGEQLEELPADAFGG
jgi:hypothetical protein